MATVTLSVTADTSVLSQAIPQIVAFGRRTMAQQCVTSAVFIAFRAQELTPATEISRIDSELSAEFSPGRLKSGKLSKAKKRQEEVVSTPQQGLAAMIVVARMNPNSAYSLSTGNRWPVAVPNTKGKEAFWAAVQVIAGRMVKARHSSTHFLRTGWTPAIRIGLSNPNYKYFQGGVSRKAARQRPNALTTIDPMQLGDMQITISGDSAVVTGENNVGEGGNAVLDAKHRLALIQHGVPALQQAVNEETDAILIEVERRLAAGWKQEFGNI